MYETLIINGFDLAQYTTCIQSLDGLYNMGTPRGDNIVFPGVDGETWVDKPFAGGTIELGLFLVGETTAEFNTILRELRTIVSPGQRVTMERRLSYTGGNETQTCNGEFVGGLAPTLQFMRFGRASLTMKVLDGVWYSSNTILTGTPTSGTLTVPGETRTHRMTLELPAESSFTNATNGHVLTLAAPAGGIVTVDVERMTATQDGNDVSYALGWNKRYPMRLEPGINNIVASATGNLSYRAAYL